VIICFMSMSSVRRVMKGREMLILITNSSAGKHRFSLGWCSWDV